MARVAITGVAGFIGSHVAEAALSRGFFVRGLDVIDRAPAGVERVVGDVREAAAAARLCSGADFVVHTAAIVGESGRKELFWRINVEGTRVVARAAREAGVRRFVHISSVMVYGFRYPPGVTEDGPLAGEGNPYCETKIESERVARAFREPGNLDVVALRLGDVYGPGSVPWVIRPLELMRRRLFILPSGGRGVLNPVHIDDVVRAVFLALDRPVSGAFNITGGAAVTCREYFSRLAALAGRRGVPSLPAPLLHAGFTALAALAPLFGQKPIAYASGVDFLMRPYAYSIEKARRDLGYEPSVGLDEGLRRLKISMN